jgi:hypothetical protein
MAKRGVERRGVGLVSDGWGLKAGCSERWRGAGEWRQRRVAKNVSKRMTGETKERLTGGPNVFKI